MSAANIGTGASQSAPTSSSSSSTAVEAAAVAAEASSPCPTPTLPPPDESAAKLDSIANKLRSLLAQLDSSAEQDNLLSVSEWTIREHCDSLRQQVDIARETALESIHKASHTLIIEIDAYEQECLSRWTAAKESIEDAVKNLSERMREFVAKQHAFLQSQQEREGELIQRLNNVKQWAKRLSDGKKLLKSAMLGNRFATFDARPSIGDAMPLGELTFAHMQLPIGTLDTTDFTQLKPVDIRVPYDFLLPLEHGRRIVAFKRFIDSEYIHECFTQMSSFDQLGRLIGSGTIKFHVHREQVVHSL